MKTIIDLSCFDYQYFTFFCHRQATLSDSIGYRLAKKLSQILDFRCVKYFSWIALSHSMAAKVGQGRLAMTLMILTFTRQQFPL
ncbi:MAG: hypothetical protein ACJAWV_000302 [Flammeovirgaceae bacterium]